MSKQSNHDYYTTRIATERALAAEAHDATIAALHAELAERYAVLLEGLDDQSARPNLRAAKG